MSKYQFTELQQKFLDLFPKWDGDRNKLWQGCRDVMEKLDKMTSSPKGSVQNTDIGKLTFRVYAQITEYLGRDDTDWVALDLSTEAVEIQKADFGFGFGIKSFGEY